ncbi:MAG: DsbA family protein [Proteobacteria bacterium]|jgi:protein-disulfide isomerase|nr:DsbA family protein [Pseudomonadota bacterium]
MNRILTLGLCAVLAVGISAFFNINQYDYINLSLHAETQDTSVSDSSEIVEMTIGDVGAPVTMVEYASFTCPHCKNFHLNVFDKLKSEYIDTGKVRFVFREVYFDRFGLWAGMVARCSGEKSYFGMVDMIFQKQTEWTKGEQADIVNNLKKIGRVAGLDNESLDSCLQDIDRAKAMVEIYRANSVADKIESTPSFIINGKLYSNMDYNALKEVLDGKLN